MNNNNSLENQPTGFILDILEEQKRRKRRRIDLIREEFNQSSQLEQELINELENMAEYIPHQAQPSQKTTCSKRTRPSNRKGKKPNLNRDHVAAHQKLIQDFFRFESINEQQQDHQFYSKFKIPMSLFNRIHADLTKNDLHFTQRKGLPRRAACLSRLHLVEMGPLSYRLER
ncbi:hypothetical protein VP01_346g2 [Puccinia sorghi]|uniref:Uncharacterized protein n=1 Tax=Puccinia sorghi TaxID=27349 RepID=A0A0L6UW11_9BASI|nr:hypothetical protein VP01_346g2 [Puccinia sorghi]